METSQGNILDSGTRTNSNQLPVPFSPKGNDLESGESITVQASVSDTEGEQDVDFALVHVLSDNGAPEIVSITPENASYDENAGSAPVKFSLSILMVTI